jgi:PAS domain S-box-containing protein
LGLMRQLIEGKIPRFTMEKRNVRRDGTVFWVNLNVSPLWQPGEKPLRHVAAVQDITARKVAEENYRRELEYNRALVGTTSAYLAAVDVKVRFMHVNRAFVSGLGYAEEDLLGKTPWEIGMLDEAETKRSKKRFHDLLRGEDSPPVEVRLKTKGGEWRTVELRSALTRTMEGEPDRLLITGTDLTERNRLQQEVLNIVEREQARLGHDLHDGVGQTMTGIVALIEALECEAPEPLKEDAARIRKLVQSAVAEIRRMSHGLSPTGVKYRGLGGALKLLAETVRLNHRKECECKVDARITIADPEIQTHLFRIAQEAVNNALRHGDPSRIWISLKRTVEGEVVLSIEDDGRGIGKVKQRRRGKGGTATSPGIGLRVMEYRANLVGASLTVRPRPEGGVVVECGWRADKKQATALSFSDDET